MTKHEINRKITEMRVENEQWADDERANAILLDEMPSPCLTHVTVETGGVEHWVCWPDHIKHHNSTDSPDRKTCVALAWLKWKEAL